MFSRELNRRVSIEYKSIERDANYGTDIVTWVRLEPVWAKVKDLPSGSESSELGLTLSRGAKEITIRWRQDIESSMRFVVHGDTDEVVQMTAPPIEVGGRKQYLLMKCERISIDGE